MALIDESQFPGDPEDGDPDETEDNPDFQESNPAFYGRDSMPRESLHSMIDTESSKRTTLRAIQTDED